MHRLVLSAFVAIACMSFFSCQNKQKDAWDAFTACGTTACVEEVLAVKDAFLNDPKAILSRFNESNEKGEDHVVGWLYILRDSVLVNSNFASVEERFKLQQQIVEVAKPFQEDPQYKEFATMLVDEIGMLAIASELEDDIVEPASEPFIGTYSFELPNEGGSGELLVTQVSIDQIKFKLMVVGGKPAHNQGLLEGTANILGSAAEFSTTEFGGTCKLSFDFSSDAVKIETIEGDAAACGFGNGVSANGTYKRDGYTDPFLSAADAKKAAQLQGTWQSLDDPKAVIKIVDGKYLDVYDGEEVNTALNIYYPQCPKDCNPVGAGACIKNIAQDEVCFAIVSVTAQNLELSQIGGTGNTNRYKRVK